jgi:DNA-binding transcriptional ArsR family regulator
MPALRDLVRKASQGAFLGAALAAIPTGRALPQGTPPPIPIPADPEALRDFALRQAARVTELERIATGLAPPSPLVLGGFILFIAVVAFGLGRYAWQLRRDFVTLLTTAPRDPGVVGADRLEIFRDAPGGMPDGTIRGVIAMAIVLVALPAMVFSKALGLTSTGEFGTIIGGVLGFYFGTRSSGGEAEAARRQADFSLREAQAARQAKEEAERTASAAEAAKQQAQQEAGRVAEAAAEVATAAEARARETGEAAARIAQLASRAAEGVAVARAIAGLLPAGPAAKAVIAATGTAGAVLAEASRATTAIGGAIANPTAESVTAAVDAASAVLKSAGEGTEVAARLQGALDALREATSAIGAVRAAVESPTAERIAAALAEAGRVVEGRPDGGLGGALAPALGVLGSAMRLPGLAGLLGAATPVGLAGGLMLGAWQAAQLGRQHYTRWMARVLDRPVSRDLFPGGEWDGEAARALIAEVPALARALAAELGPDAPQEAAAGALGRLLDAGAGSWLWEARKDAFASEAEAEAAVAALRRRVLEAELDRVDVAPVALGGGIGVAQARLREDLDRLREAGAGEAIDTLALLADGVINARPEVPAGLATAPAGLDVPALLARALRTAEPAGQAMERAPAPPAPPAEGA